MSSIFERRKSSLEIAFVEAGAFDVFDFFDLMLLPVGVWVLLAAAVVVLAAGVVVLAAELVRLVEVLAVDVAFAEVVFTEEVLRLVVVLTDLQDNWFVQQVE